MWNTSIPCGHGGYEAFALGTRSAPVTAVLLGVLAAGALSAPAAAHPPAPVDVFGQPVRGKMHAWMHQAKVPLVRGRVQISRSLCPGNPTFAACVLFRTPRTIYMLPKLREPRRLLYHELGHVFDLRVLNGRERRRFKRIAGIRRDGWFHGGLPPAEWFADGYATCAAHQRVRRGARATPYGYAPRPRQHRRVCRLIRNAAKPRGRPPSPPPSPPPVIEVAPPPPQEPEPGEAPPSCTLIDELLTGCRAEPALP